MSHEEIIEALYRGILARDSDESGLRGHVDALTKNKNPQALVDVVKSFVEGSEFKARLNEDRFKPILKSLNSTLKIESDAIHHVMSIGASCATSDTLQRWHLRKFAGPFDWIFSSIAMIHHVLWDDFRTFLDTGQMVPITDTDGTTKAVEHRFYRQYAQHPPGHEGAPVFLHHDAIGKDHAHFQRAADRTRAALGQSTLLVGFYRNFPGQAEAFAGLAQFLLATAPQCRLMAFIAIPEASSVLPEIRLLDSAGPHLLYQVKCIGKFSEFGFEDIFDELTVMKLIFQYDFALQGLD